MKEREANRRYRLELFSAMLAYMAMLIGSIYLAKGMDPGTPRTLLLLSPVVPLMLAIWAIARHFGGAQTVYLNADICRSDLLVEIEGVYVP